MKTLSVGGEASPPQPRFRRLVKLGDPIERAGWPQPESYRLRSQPLVMGREGDIPVPDPRASRRHAQIKFHPSIDAARIEDLSSKNGTFMNGERLEEARLLEDGAVLRIGDTVFVFEEREDHEAGLGTCPPQLSLRSRVTEALVDRAAPTELPVLIRGPSGAGKERLAVRLHEQSGRKGALVSVNCASFNPELLASELFGHQAGAFSGAQQDREGLFRAAQGGTIFLDEVAEMPLEQQPVLLRVLQEKRVRPVGADHELPVDVRVVAATHGNLGQLEHEGRFRGDLLARLSAVEIEVSGLSERRVEILPLLESFLGPGATPPTADAAEVLLLHPWPKNIRELSKCAHYLRLFRDLQRPFEPSDLHPDFGRERASIHGEASSAAVHPPPRRLERGRLAELLTEHRGNVASVARALGLSRQLVYRRLRSFGLKAEDYRDG